MLSRSDEKCNKVFWMFQSIAFQLYFSMALSLFNGTFTFQSRFHFSIALSLFNGTFTFQWHSHFSIASSLIDEISSNTCLDFHFHIYMHFFLFLKFLSKTCCFENSTQLLFPFTFKRHFHFSMVSSLGDEIPSKTCCFETSNQSLKIQFNFSHRSDFCEELT